MNDKPKFNPQKHHRRSIRLKGYDYSQAGAYFVTFCIKDRECLFGKITDAEMHLNEAGWMIDKWWQKIPEKFPDIELGEYQIMPNHFHAIAINVGADPRVRPVNHDRNDKSIVTGNNPNVGADPRVRPENPRVRPVNHDRNDRSIVTGNNPNVGADPRVRPENPRIRLDNDWNDTLMNAGNEFINTQAVEQLLFCSTVHEGEQAVEQLLFGSTVHEGEHVGSPLHEIVQWFKTMPTNEYIRNVKRNGWPPFNGKLWQRNYFEHIIRNEKSFQRITDYIHNNPANWKDDKFFVG